MKPAWDKLMGEYKDSKDVLIGDCDCKSDCKSLCEDFGVGGYPTLKYGDPSALEDYRSGRDYDSLKKHAETYLESSCSPTHIHLCDATQKAEIKKFQAMQISDLDSEILNKELKIGQIEFKFRMESDKLQAAYKTLQENKEEAIKDSGIDLMKAVKKKHKKH
jgi:hypothetical protein